MKILVVEDDQTVAQALEHLLASCRYAVDLAADGESGLQMAETFSYDMILLDILLPQLDGVSLCQKLRAKRFQTPILLLTGQGGAHQKAIALNAGADDYVVKPFDAEELIARVQALLRRGGPKTQPVLMWGHLSVDPSSRKVTYGTHTLSMTPKEYAILELFMRSNQRIFSARAILDHVWNSLDSPGEEAVRVHIKELRKKLKAVGAAGDFIKTVYGTGYRLNPLYSLDVMDDKPLTPAQIAELQSTNQELRDTISLLQTAMANLREQNHKLTSEHQTLKQQFHQTQGTPGYDAIPIPQRLSQVSGNVCAESSIVGDAIISAPLTVPVDTAVRDAIALMNRERSAQHRRASCVLVMENDQVVGILTEQDVVHLNDQHSFLEDLVIREVMSCPVVSLTQAEFTSLGSAIELLQQHHIRHLPILDDHGHLAGVVTYETLWMALHAVEQHDCG